MSKREKMITYFLLKGVDGNENLLKGVDEMSFIKRVSIKVARQDKDVPEPVIVRDPILLLCKIYSIAVCGPSKVHCCLARI